jgi:hypothetical protein
MKIDFIIASTSPSPSLRIATALVFTLVSGTILTVFTN